MRHEEDRFQTRDGLQLHENRWLPEGDPVAVVVVVHGFVEHSGRYAELAGRLNREGYAVYAMDLRGHGKSKGERVFISSFDEFLYAYFLGGNHVTLPVYMWTQVRFPQTLPTILAVGSCIFMLSASLLLTAEWLRRMGSRQTKGVP